MTRPIHILVVDDDELDALHVKRALQGVTEVDSISVATDGIDALTKLQQGDVPKQRLIMLVDWRMPRMNGAELMSVLRADRALSRIPVIVMTTSANPEDRAQAYQLGASGYFVKPGSTAPFRAIMEAIYGYWSLAEFPQ